MRPSVRLALIAALLAATLPGSAEAVVASTCGSAVTAGTTSCTFYLAGGYLSVEASAPGGTVYVRITDAAGAVAVLSCYGYGGCGGSTVAPLTDPFVELPAGTPLTCTVTTSSAGTFRCMSIL